jgi:hypothetical protein
MRGGWQFFAHMNVSQYKIQDEIDDRVEAYATGIGILKRFGHDLQVRAEWQYLKNAISNYDTRIHFRVMKGFALR